MVIKKLILSRTEAADLLGVHRRTLEAWERRGGGPKVIRMPSGLPRYHIDEINRFAREGVPEQHEAATRLLEQMRGAA